MAVDPIARGLALKKGSGGTGENGGTFTPVIDEQPEQTILSWTNDKGLKNPDPVNIKGYTPKKGIDYYTEQEKEELIQEVLSKLPMAEEVNF